MDDITFGRNGPYGETWRLNREATTMSSIAYWGRVWCLWMPCSDLKFDIRFEPKWFAIWWHGLRFNLKCTILIGFDLNVSWFGAGISANARAESKVYTLSSLYFVGTLFQVKCNASSSWLTGSVCFHMQWHYNDFLFTNDKRHVI